MRYLILLPFLTNAFVNNQVINYKHAMYKLKRDFLINSNNDFNDLNPVDNNQLPELKCYGNTDFSKKNLNDKKLITISPGGVQGFYMLGVIKFLCNEYDIHKNNSLIFSGASAGSWISLVLCLKKDVNQFIDDILALNFSKADSILEWELIIKDYVLNYYRITDFDFNKIFISVTRISMFDNMKVFKLHNDIYSDFSSLLDVLDCCVASSHIPFITGGLFNKYKKKFGYDGGFLGDPYIKNVTKILQIQPNMYSNKEIEYSLSNSLDINGLLNKDNIDIHQLFNHGYTDSQVNKKYLDRIFK